MGWPLFIIHDTALAVTMLSLHGAASTRCVLRAAAASSSSRRHVNPTLVPSTHRRAHTRVPLVLTRASGEEKDEEVLDVGAMVDVDAIRAAVNDDPEVRAQEQKIAKEARNMASIQVDAEMAQEEAKIALEIGANAKDASSKMEQAQEAALADLEASAAAVLAAETKMATIARERQELMAEADAEGGAPASKRKWGSTVADDVDEDAERIESAKAATAAAVSGALLSLPLTVSQSPGGIVTLESVAGIFLSCAVFGVTYRYAVRDDLGNDQLKGGVVGAFGLARGLGSADVYLHGSDAGTFASWAEAALLAGESVLVFAFAAAALEAGFTRELIEPFPMKKKQ